MECLLSENCKGFGRQSLRTNTVTPNIFVGPIWIPDEPPAVEIIELNSSNEELSPRDLNPDGRRHAWSYVNSEVQHFENNNYKINKQARERRRFQNASQSALATSSTLTESNNYNSDIPNNLFKHHSDTGEKLKFNNQVKSFNVINEHITDSDTEVSDGDYADVEIITSGDILLGGSNNWDPRNNNFFQEEIITYDTDLDQETRTIWIYSFKNKHLLADDDFEALPYKESSSSSFSTDSSGEQSKDKPCRIGSPTATYIPRLDLSLVPTLSTVVEISERNVSTSPKSVKSTSRKIQTQANNWFVSESAKEGRRSIRKHEKSTNIINWMGLSPRERRRVLKDKTVSDAWVGSCLNLSEVCTDTNKEDRGDQVNKYAQSDGVAVQVDVDVHVDYNEANGDKAKTEPNSANDAVKTIKGDISSINKIKYADAASEDFQKDRGDHAMKLVAPAIRVTPKFRKTYITDPIEKLDNSNWIEENREKETKVYDYVLEMSESVLDVANTVNVVDHLWMKNTIPFLKPSHWNEFKPIAESPMSYHISIGSIEERKTWFKRLINFLNCCK